MEQKFFGHDFLLRVGTKYFFFKKRPKNGYFPKTFILPSNTDLNYDIYLLFETNKT